MQQRMISPIAHALLVLALGCSAAWAQQQTNPRDQVAAASHRAIEALRAEIGPEPIGRGATVNDLLSKTNSAKIFMKTLARAQQIGGPRWIDQQTCQVRLEISGAIVARKLVEIATLDHLESPVPPEVLQYQLRDWDNRTFSATGTSACASAALAVQPTDASAGWAGISAASRRQAVHAARNDAASEVVQSIGSIQLTGGQTVADLLKKSPSAGQDLFNWLQGRPVTQVQFMDNQRVQVTISIAPDELTDALQSALEHGKVSPAPDPALWKRVQNEIASRFASGAATGAASAAGGQNSQPAITLPQTAPSWASQQIEATGIVHTGHGLKAARAAEADADDKLRGQILLLPLDSATSLAQAARSDPAIAQAIDRALGRARTTGAQYLPDGGAKVTATLDLQDLWQELAEAR